MAFPTGTSVTLNKFYRRFDDEHYIYRLIESTTTGISVLLKTPQYNSCSAACLYTSTPTALPTYTPTPTNTNTPVPATYTPTPTPSPESFGVHSGYGSAYDACQVSPNNTVYAPTGNTVIYGGLILYSNSELTTTYNGGNTWNFVTKDGTNWAAYINTNGEIIDYTLCSSVSGPTVTPVPTDTPTPTPTLTPSGSTDVSGFNNFFGGVIANITIGGIVPSGISFPVSIGDGFSGTVALTGTQLVQVTLSNVNPDGCLTVSTTANGPQSINVSGGATFSQNMDITGGISINGAEGACA